jgi:hypothetical protein
VNGVAFVARLWLCCWRESIVVDGDG